MSPHSLAQRLLGPIDWQNDVSGFCPCPGHLLHTTRTGPKDCRVNLDGAPTIFCFHSSCSAAVAEANRRLRAELGAKPWQITLPGGRVLRNGDLLQSSGAVLPRETIMARARANAQNQNRDPAESLLLQSLRVMAERFRPDMLERFHWPFDQIVADSPLAVSQRDPEDQFRTWLRLWPPHSTIWIGDVFSSGKPEHRSHFRPVADWYQIGPVMGNFTCGSAFAPGSCSRTNDNCTGARFMVVESDTLDKNHVGAIFAYLNRRLHFNLHAIIDTAGKSLHAWFDPPRNPQTEGRLKAVLTVFGCDPKLFTYSQPVRLPGAYRNANLQRLIWLRQL